jgi:DNA-binding response OmpR family regulator
LKILIVEDEMLVAMFIEDAITDLGHQVVGPAMRLDKALAAARCEQFDFAILDINLAGEQSFPVADILTQRGIPFMFASGYGVAGLIERYRHVPVLQKPFDPSQLEAIVGRAKASVDG